MAFWSPADPLHVRPWHPRPDLGWMQCVSGDDDLIRLERWAGPWTEEDPDAAFKEEVAAYARLDPLVTLQGLSEYCGIPVGALARYVLVKWCAAGSEGLLELGPTMLERLWAHVAEAERAGDDAARLAAYHALKDMLSWLRAGLTGSQ